MSCIGQEIDGVPKAAGGDRKSKLAKRQNLISGRSAIPIPSWSRARIVKWAVS
jgi:hypothetical protein